MELPCDVRNSPSTPESIHPNVPPPATSEDSHPDVPPPTTPVTSVRGSVTPDLDTSPNQASSVWADGYEVFEWPTTGAPPCPGVELVASSTSGEEMEEEHTPTVKAYSTTESPTEPEPPLTETKSEGRSLNVCSVYLIGHRPFALRSPTEFDGPPSLF